MKKILIFTFIITSLSSVARADAESRQRGGVCFTNNPRIRDAEIIWNCEHIGMVTVKQIYQKGFRVVGAFPTSYSNTTIRTPYFIIEEQRK